ncbi:DNA methyltransferase [uncultured Desulfosarcina sp.]|uniref:DNA methyltransferase n=1 Tax=uncultured Desulfosarcina sp. TaxID=218289 RepID=UPI00374A4E19
MRSEIPDTFSGSGTIAPAARQSGRKYIGIETGRQIDFFRTSHYNADIIKQNNCFYIQ